jgi:hypothetical protein
VETPGNTGALPGGFPGLLPALHVLAPIESEHLKLTCALRCELGCLAIGPGSMN